MRQAGLSGGLWTEWRLGGRIRQVEKCARANALRLGRRSGTAGGHRGPGDGGDTGQSRLSDSGRRAGAERCSGVAIKRWQQRCNWPTRALNPDPVMLGENHLAPWNWENDVYL